VNSRNLVLSIVNNGMGKGPEDLQLTLLGKYLQLLDQNGQLPAVICFYTEGVKTVVNDSPVLDALLALEKKGVRLIVCSTCLGYFNLTDQVKVGIIGSMADILEAQLRAEKVITL
jgi:hypothetical protein